MDSETVAAWVEAIGTWLAATLTFFVLLWAVFHERLIDWFNRPKLSVSIRPSAPDCMKLLWGMLKQRADSIEVPLPVPVYYLRLRVSNFGSRKADTLQVRLAKVEQLDKDGNHPIPSLSNLNLTWARKENGDNLVFLPTLQRRAFEHCNLAHVFRPTDRHRKHVFFLFEQKEWPHVSKDQTILSLDVADKAFHLPHLLPPGSYRFHLAVSSADVAPVTKTIDLTLTGDWYDDEGEMFLKGVTVSESTH